MVITRLTTRFVYLLSVLLIQLPTITNAAVGRTDGVSDVSATGEATYSIPITVPSGINGLTPELALVYGHRKTEGLAGVGWGISGLSEITRCGKTIAQDGVTKGVELVTTDRYCVDGVQLRVTTGNYGGQGSRYRTEVDTVGEYVSLGTAGAGPQYWTLRTKNGLNYEYGGTSDSRIETLASGYGSTVIIWALNEISDRNGNEILFTYIEDGTPYGGHRIDYITYRSNPGQSVTSAYKIDFEYETQPADDVDSSFAAGGKIEDIKRLTNIEVLYTPASPDTLVRSYELAYESSLSTANRSRLESIEECAGSTPVCLSPTTFTYQDGTVSLGNEVSTGSTVATGVNVLPLDINGDGRTDIAYSSSSGSGTWYYQLANASGGYGSAQNSSISNTNHAKAIVIDYNHDGLEDILVPYSGGTWWAIQGSTTGLQSPVNTSAAATSAAGDATALDLDGDGRDDLVWGENVGQTANSKLLVRYRQTGTGFSSTPTTLFSGGTGNTQLAGPTLFVGSYVQNRSKNFDANGDGIHDIAIVTIKRGGSRFEPWEIFWTDVILGGGAGSYNVLGDSSSGLPIDINGDGYTDIAYQTYTSPLKIRLSTGKSFNTLVTDQSLSGYNFSLAVVTDYNNDGMQDLLIPKISANEWYFFRSEGDSFATAVTTGKSASGAVAAFGIDSDGDGLGDIGYLNSSRVYVHRAHSGVKPDLLDTVTDGHDNSAAFSYSPITQDSYVKGTTATFPDQDYNGPLHVVTSAVKSTGVGTGTYTLTYEYEEALYHREGRGLSPFSQRSVVDSRNSVEVVEKYGTEFPYRGRLTDQDTKQSSGTPIQQLSYTWTETESGSGIQTYHYPYVSDILEKNYEVGGTYNGVQLNEVDTAITIDSYGTPTSIEKITTEKSGANGAQSAATYTEKTVNSSITNNTTSWCIGNVGKTQWINSHTQDATYGAQITRTVDRVWDSTSKCRVTKETTEPLSSSFKVTKDIGYDAFGNVNSETVTGISMAARVTTANWGTTGQFPESITNALGQTSTISWNLTHGLRSSMTDPNSLSVSWLYDDLGRRTKETRVDGTYSEYTLSDCNLANNYCGTAYDRVRVKVNASSKKTTGTEIRADVSYLDKAGRPVQTEVQSMAGTMSRTRTVYDSIGRVSEEYMPTFSASPSFHASATYDVLNRLTQISRPIDENTATLQYTTIDYDGLTTTITDPESKDSIKVRDAMGRVFRSEDHDGHYQQFDLDAFGSLRRVKDNTNPVNTLLEATYAYGIGAFRLTSDDMDLGDWDYTPNALGEVVAHTDAKSQSFSATFDKLSRPLTRTEPGNTTTWTWGTSAAAHNIGRLASISNTGHSESYTYDSYGRVSQRSTVADTTYLTNFGYDSTSGLLDTMTYPTSTASYRLKLEYAYQYGMLQAVSDYNASSTVFWTADAVNARGNIAEESLGTDLSAEYGYDAVTGLPDYIQSGPTGSTTARQDLTYEWNKVGSLTQRYDANRSLTEDFYYDDLHRLEYSELDQVQNLAVTYDGMGNITSKDDVGTGTWTYHSTKKHAVTSVPGFTFTYDDNGNQVTRNSDDITWTSYNYPNEIENGSTSHEFFYDGFRNRWKQVYTNSTSSETTIYVGDGLAKRTEGSYSEYRHFIKAGGRSVAIYTRPTTGSVTTRYLLRDHQGNVSEVTDDIGDSDVSESFTAYGERRDPVDWAGSISAGDKSAISAATDRGYTFHTNLEESSLIHMNGRVMDGLTGRFLSADPYVPHAGITQSFNRYSYVRNNPLTLVDPSGFCDGINRRPCIRFIGGEPRGDYHHTESRESHGVGGHGDGDPGPEGCPESNAAGCWGRATGGASLKPVSDIPTARAIGNAFRDPKLTKAILTHAGLANSDYGSLGYYRRPLDLSNPDEFSKGFVGQLMNSGNVQSIEDPFADTANYVAVGSSALLGIGGMARYGPAIAVDSQAAARFIAAKSQSIAAQLESYAYQWRATRIGATSSAGTMSFHEAVIGTVGEVSSALTGAYSPSMIYTETQLAAALQSQISALGSQQIARQLAILGASGAIPPP